MNAQAIRALLDLRIGDWLTPIDTNQPTEGFIMPDAQVREFIDAARLVVVDRTGVRMTGTAVWEYTQAVPHREPVWAPELPFPSTYLAILSQLPDATGLREPFKILGFLVTENSMFVHGTADGGRTSLVEVVAEGRGRHLSDGGLPTDREPIIMFMLWAMALCRASMNAGTTSVHVPGAMRRKLEQDARKVRAPFAPVPRDYYTVNIEDRIRWQGVARTFLVEQGPCYRVGHRHDVRSHPRLLVERGPVEQLDAKRFRSLTKRGYTVWTGREDDPIDDDLEHLLFKRGVRRGADEYLAALRVVVQAHIRGPADRPYVPAAWRLTMRDIFTGDEET